MRERSTCFMLVLTVASLALGQDSVSSNFQSGSDGWQVADLRQPLANPPVVAQHLDVSWSSSGGNPGGYIQRQDPGDNWFWFSAPAQFLGNHSAAYGRILAFDLACTGNDGVPYPGIILIGAGTPLYYELTPPPTDFKRYSVGLSEAGWHVGSMTGALASSAQMKTVLGALGALYINADWQGGYETTSLDNVILLPEPGCTGMLLGAVYAVCLPRRRVVRV